MHVGITGASGLIGTALTEHLQSVGHHTTAFVRRSPRDGEIELDPGTGRLVSRVLTSTPS